MRGSGKTINFCDRVCFGKITDTMTDHSSMFNSLLSLCAQGGRLDPIHCRPSFSHYGSQSSGLRGDRKPDGHFRVLRDRKTIVLAVPRAAVVFGDAVAPAPSTRRPSVRPPRFRNSCRNRFQLPAGINIVGSRLRWAKTIGRPRAFAVDVDIVFGTRNN